MEVGRGRARGATRRAGSGEGRSKIPVPTDEREAAAGVPESIGTETAHREGRGPRLGSSEAPREVLGGGVQVVLAWVDGVGLRRLVRERGRRWVRGDQSVRDARGPGRAVRSVPMRTAERETLAFTSRRSEQSGAMKALANSLPRWTKNGSPRCGAQWRWRGATARNWSSRR